MCPSKCLADCVLASALLGNWLVAVVPNPIDTDRWQTLDQRLARQLLRFPQDCPLLLFGAIGCTSDPRKGIDLLISAFTQLRREGNLQDLQFVVFGQPVPQSPPKLGFPVHYIGHLHDDLILRIVHSAADLMLVPSRKEALAKLHLKPKLALRLLLLSIPLVWAMLSKIELQGL